MREILRGLGWGIVLPIVLLGASGCSAASTEVSGTAEFSARQIVAPGPRGLGPVGERGEWTVTGGAQTAKLRPTADTGAVVYTSTVHAAVAFVPRPNLELSVTARIPLSGSQSASTEPLLTVRGTPSPELGLAARLQTKPAGPVKGLFGLQIGTASLPFHRVSNAEGIENRKDCPWTEPNCGTTRTTSYGMHEDRQSTDGGLYLGMQAGVLLEVAAGIHTELGVVLQAAPGWRRTYQFQVHCDDAGPECLQDSANRLPSGRIADQQLAPYLAFIWRTGPISLLASVYTLAVSQRMDVPIAGGGGVRLHF